MRIGLISFEFPPSPFVGGIGTYTRHAASVLHEAGHDVEVFAAGAADTRNAFAYPVWRVDVTDRRAFRAAVAARVEERHRHAPFAVVESPEFGAEGALVSAVAPEIARVTRLHTPSFMVAELNRTRLPLAASLRFMFGGLRRGRLTWPRVGLADPADDRLEREAAADSDVVAAPCHSIRETVLARWNLPPERCLISPNLFRPDPTLLAVGPAETGKTVLFLGRLEPRKGVFELVRAIPAIVRAHPDTHVMFVGAAVPLPGMREDCADYVRNRLRHTGAKVTVSGNVDFRGVVAALRQCNVVVLPSRWENFPNVCLEAMAAARAVVGTTSGGMADMIDDGVTGKLIPPRNPRAIATALTLLLRDPKALREMGCAARKRLETTFSLERSLSAHLSTYVQALENAQRRRGTSVSN